MSLLVGLVAGFLTGRLVWVLLRPSFASAPVVIRDNYRGRPVMTAVGVVLAIVAVLVEAGRVVAGAVGIGEGVGLPPSRVAVVLVAIGLGLLGIVDDLAGSGDDRGFRGHLGALVSGRLTTGGVKLLGGFAVAVVAAATTRPGSGAARLLADAALVALAANLANLFDRAPGRTIKVAGVSLLSLALATGAAGVLAPVAVLMGAAMGLLIDDLRERVMLGDAGANVLGGVLGLGVVLACAPSTRTVVLVVVLALNLASELVSFSRVIDRVRPLRAFDELGRLRP